MRITRLELHGFKSFADRQVFHFEGGISAVVGPNGCGKSNVVDALKWVIGEQSAKSLRGGEMSDVIFAGSSERKPVGYAEVALTLNAETGEPFPGEYARYTEIQIARRLYRSGASEYLINHTRVRRKDIVNLIMDSGIGNNLYSFIEQGRIDKIVSASPLERRSLIDEAAGITRYKKRRAEAQSKLEATGGQLDRAADVTDEMERRLKSLERQVAKAARFRRLRARVRQDEIFLGLVKYASLSQGLEEDEARTRQLLADTDTAEQTVERCIEDLELRTKEAGVAEESAERARDRLAEADAQRREVDASFRLYSQRHDEVAGQLADARSARDKAEALVEAAEARATEARRALESLGERRDTVLEAVKAARTEESRVGQQLDGLRAEALEVRRRAGEAASDRDTLADKVAEREARLAGLPAERARLVGAVESAEQELVVLDKRRTVAEEALEARRAELSELTDRRQALTDAIDAAERRDLHARDAVTRAEQDLDVAQRALAEEAERAAQAEADDEVEAAVAPVRARVEAGLRAAEREDQARVGAAEQSARRRLEAQESRARAWVDAVVREADDAIARWRRRADTAIEAEDARRASAIDALDAEGMARVSQAEDAARAEAAEKVQAARARRDKAVERLEAARQSLTDLDAELARARQGLQAVEGRITALQAEESAALAGDAGTAAVAEALPEARRLVDHVGDVDADTAAALGDRLLLPVLGPDDIATAADATRAAGRARVLLVEGRPTAEALTAEVSVVDTLDDAVAHHLATGGAAVVRGQGERVGADGVLHLGRQADKAAAMLARRAQLAELETERAAQAERVEALETERTQRRASVEGGQITVRRAGELLEEVERSTRETVTAAVEAARAEVEGSLRSLREDRVQWRAAARADLEAELARREAARAETVEDVRQRARVVTQEARTAVEAELEGLRASVADEAQARRDEADASIEAARTQALAARRERLEAGRASRERLQEEVSTLRATLDTARSRATTTREALREARKDLEAHDRRRAETELVLTRIEAEVGTATAQRQTLSERLERHRQQIVEVDEESTRLTEALARDRAAASTRARAAEQVEARRVEIEAELATVQATFDAARSTREQAEEARATLLADEARFAAQRESADREQHGARERRDEAAGRIDALTALVEEAARQRDEASSRLDTLSGARQEAAVALEAARARVSEARTARDAAAAALKEAEDEEGELQRELVALEQAVIQAREGLRQTSERIEERYQVDIPAALAHIEDKGALRLEAPEEVREPLQVAKRTFPAIEDRVIRHEQLEDEQRIRDTVERLETEREKLRRVGDVNLTALEEYTELDERFGELVTQREDLEDSVSSIRAAIAKMNRTCRERFRETFDQVNQEFSRAYPELVGGGEARLSLTDEEDLLETGVDIFVRPPGKRLQNLRLLSGGEKAMTAIALLLALFSVKPSPFCVLDEVDAPLDEANGARFNDMLRHMAMQTQFIVITHNRKTMECADTLYGITMPTPGCSALVSVQVGD